MAGVSFDIEKAKTSNLRDSFIPNPKLKLLDQVSEVMRFKHYSMDRGVLHQDMGQIDPVVRPAAGATDGLTFRYRPTARAL
jgi:hypothetical protein